MSNFFKDMLNSFKEGMAKGKAELEQEMAKNIETEDFQKNTVFLTIENIPNIEKFGTALGAPFRTVIFGDWFSLFKNNFEDLTQPIHLYTFGNYQGKSKYEKELSKYLNRDFNITNKESCLQVLAAYFRISGIETNHITLNNYHNNLIDETIWDMTKSGTKALICAVTSHIVSASVDVDYLSKDEGLKILLNISNFAKKNYSNWNDYSKAFLTGNQNIKLSNAIGRSVLKKHVGHLKTKKGSPWNLVTW